MSMSPPFLQKSQKGGAPFGVPRESRGDQGKPSRQVGGAEEKMKRQSDVVKLVNISTQKWPPRQRTYLGALTIASPEPGEAYASTAIEGCKGVIDLGDWQTMEFAISAREIAEDLAREINGDSGEGSFHGVFVAAGDAPTEGELGEARRRVEEFQGR